MKTDLQRVRRGPSLGPGGRTDHHQEVFVRLLEMLAAVKEAAQLGVDTEGGHQDHGALDVARKVH